MKFSLKQDACIALGNKNIFTLSAIQQYLYTSDYSHRVTWAKQIQMTGKTCMYVTSLEDDVTSCRRKSFRLLCQLQLKEFMLFTEDEALKKYMQMQLYLHDGTVICERAKMQQQVNNLEVKLINTFSTSDASHAMIRRFLTTALLFGDRYYLYDEATKQAFALLCKHIA